MHTTPRYRTVTSRAAALATQRGHDHIGVEHLMLAILAEGDSIPAQVLRDLGVDEALRQRLGAIMSDDTYRPTPPHAAPPHAAPGPADRERRDPDPPSGHGT